MTPFRPALSTAALSPTGGRLGPLPAHFVVEEIPAYLPSGTGEHLFVWLEKEGKNTADVARLLGKCAGVKDRDIGYAGLKDRNAVTRQWFSLPRGAKPPSEWALPADVRVLETSHHQNKLRTGHLHGNRFVLTLVDVPDGGLERAQKLAAWISEKGISNAFGPQRFGRGGQNLDDALAWLASDDARPSGSRFDQKMLPSVLQSEIFNRYLSARIADPRPLLSGEVVRLDGTGKHFVVEDVAAELPRFEARDLHLTGPMIGPKTLQSQGEALELEERIQSELGLGAAALERLGRVAPGARRDLFLRPKNLQVHSPSPGTLELSFELPAGSYATEVLREFLHE
jgi:tRNA pseudouridine13 synthase